MDLIVCPHCSVKVMPSADGICPSCRQSIPTGEISSSSQEAVSVEVVEEQSEPRDKPTTSRANSARLPAALLVALSLVGILNGVYQLIAPERHAVEESADPEIQAAARNGQAVARMAGSPIVLIMNLVMLAGSVAMFKQEHRGLALTAAILALMPCSFVFCLSMPVGVWALIAMNRQPPAAPAAQ